MISAKCSVGHKNCFYKLVDYENSILATLKPYPKSYASSKRHFLYLCEGCLRKLVINELNFIQTRLLLYLCRFTTTTITMNKLPRKTVLHVDDDPDDRELIAEAIRDADNLLAVHQENNGNAGLKYLRQCKIEGHLPCLIILDINMPEMDGRQAAKMIKADSNLREIPLIIFTTSSYPLWIRNILMIRELKWLQSHPI